MKRKIARWEAKGGKQYLELYHDTNAAGPYYSYEGNDCGGTLPRQENDEAAIAYMERPWGRGGAGPVTVLRSDFPSTKRV